MLLKNRGGLCSYLSLINCILLQLSLIALLCKVRYSVGCGHVGWNIAQAYDRVYSDSAYLTGLMRHRETGIP